MHKISHLITTESAALVEGLTEIDEQLGQDSEELAASIDQMAALLRQTLLSENGDVLHAASRVLGHLARAGGSLATECVELELRRSLEWLGGDGSHAGSFNKKKPGGRHRLAASLVLAELAENAPTLVYVHVRAVCEHVLVAMRDQRPPVREAAARALRGCLAVIGERESSWRRQWYARVMAEAIGGLQPGSAADTAHGSLLTLAELLDAWVRQPAKPRAAGGAGGGAAAAASASAAAKGPLTDGQLREMYESAWAYRDHRDRLVRLALLGLLPRVAAAGPAAFEAAALAPVAAHLLTTLRPVSYTHLTLPTKA